MLACVTGGELASGSGIARRGVTARGLDHRRLRLDAARKRSLDFLSRHPSAGVIARQEAERRDGGLTQSLGFVAPTGVMVCHQLTSSWRRLRQFGHWHAGGGVTFTMSTGSSSAAANASPTSAKVSRVAVSSALW